MYINGVGLDRVQDWYAHKIGYVLQLAVPYYEELTVRQNLFFAAHMRLTKKMSLSSKFKRVEQILAEVCQSVSQSISQLIILSIRHYVRQISQSVGQPICLPFSRSVSQSFSQTIRPSLGH